ncbi:sulfurtransferase [Effusibacillus pohliae]|uniref:sulfurtransferase n=1 Tax=Effusibacillus pohliae TaxID=232270 RepID=UPI000369134B|nr:sulfurtransferase [Effusibacillus pohliae]
MERSIVSQEWVKQQLENRQVRIVDCRFVLGQPAAGRQAYLTEHIPGALYVDLEQDLSGRKQRHGGRHPLPEVARLAAKLGGLGIDHSVQVVAYDDQGGAMASRFWWLMRYLGHTRAYVMDGGFLQWKAKGYPVTEELPSVQPATFIPQVQKHMLVSMQEVKDRIGKPGTVIIDSREAKRYKGVEEPIDPVAGHIPGALHYFWKDGLNEQGTWKSGEEQRRRFAKIDPADEVIVYCGSGVTACPNILALKEAGYQNVKLYAGSWSDWISYPDNPVERDKDAR